LGFSTANISFARIEVIFKVISFTGEKEKKFINFLSLEYFKEFYPLF